jgi:hypothetical protein
MGIRSSAGCAAALAVGALFFLPACADAQVQVDLSTPSGPPRSSLEGDRLKLAVGTALIVDARPKDDDGESLTSTIDIVAAPPFQALRTTTKNRFVIVAETSGQATLRIVVDGNDVRALTAEAL